MKDISEKYLVISFTASHQSYADSILDVLDPNNELIKFRLYRHHCIKRAIINEEDPEENNSYAKEFAYVKDLRIIKNINLKNTILIDNSVLSFAFQIDNGVPILPFYDNKEDKELLFLKNYLERISDASNLLEVNINTLKLGIMYKPFKQNNIYIDNNDEEINSNTSPSFENENSSLNRKACNSSFSDSINITNFNSNFPVKKYINSHSVVELIIMDQNNHDLASANIDSINSSINEDINSISIGNNKKNSTFKNSKIDSIIDLKKIDEKNNYESSDNSLNNPKNLDLNRRVHRSYFQNQLFSSMKDLNCQINN